MLIKSNFKHNLALVHPELDESKIAQVTQFKEN